MESLKSYIDQYYKRVRSRRSMYFLSLRRSFFITILSIIYANNFLNAQSLWVDKNPYSGSAGIEEGSVVKVIVDEPVQLDFEYENGGDEKTTVNMKPDRNITDNLPPVDLDRSIISSTKKKIRNRNSLKFQMAVQVVELEPSGIARLQGRKVIGVESGDSSVEITLQGVVNLKDIRRSGIIKSGDIANLNMQIVGLPVKKSLNLPMKQIPGETAGETLPSAKLSDEEKEEILLDYLNRILGETRDL